MGVDILRTHEMPTDIEAIRAEYKSPLAAYLLTLVANYVSNPETELKRIRELSRMYEPSWLAWIWVGLDARSPFVQRNSPYHRGVLGHSIGVCHTADEAIKWYIDLAKQFNNDVRQTNLFQWGYGNKIKETLRLQHVHPEILLDLDRWLKHYLYDIRRNRHPNAVRFRQNTYDRITRLYNAADIASRPSLMYQFNIDASRGTVTPEELFFLPTVNPEEYKDNVPFALDQSDSRTKILNNFSLLCLHLAHPLVRTILAEYPHLLDSFRRSRSAPTGMGNLFTNASPTNGQPEGYTLPQLTVALPNEIAEFNALAVE